jgi:hypothetical protein
VFNQRCLVHLLVASAVLPEVRVVLPVSRGFLPLLRDFLPLYLASSAFVKMRLAPQIQKTHRLPEPEKKSAGFLNLREITNPDDGSI